MTMKQRKGAHGNTQSSAWPWAGLGPDWQFSEEPGGLCGWGSMIQGMESTFR